MSFCIARVPLRSQTDDWRHSSTGFSNRAQISCFHELWQIVEMTFSPGARQVWTAEWIKSSFRKSILCSLFVILKSVWWQICKSGRGQTVFHSTITSACQLSVRPQNISPTFLWNWISIQKPGFENYFYLHRSFLKCKAGRDRLSSHKRRRARQRARERRGQEASVKAMEMERM